MRKYFLSVAFLLAVVMVQSQNISFNVYTNDTAAHKFKVVMRVSGLKGSSANFKMPIWTPGYYQRLDFAKNLENFQVNGYKDEPLKWSKTDDNTWNVQFDEHKSVRISYEIKTTRPFVATPYLDGKRGYIVGAGVFLYPEGLLKLPVRVELQMANGWKDVATGLAAVPGRQYVYDATDYDILYDCPILIGNLEELTPFKIAGYPHRFIGYNLGEFDKTQFMADLKKIVDAGIRIIGDIPYRDYTFIAIGPGGGGIEHLNNTTVAFSGNGMNTPQGKLRMYNFLAHEYFHHYNVKRIRPIELGPFDYDKGSRTNLLWVSEGLSVYYEYLMVKRAGLATEEELLNDFTGNMKAFETKTGKLYQTLAQSSYETWRDGPFGRTNDTVVKTISYYDKGPVVGMLFDFAIRHETKNKKSLDDVMRRLYREYYQQKKRGFTEKELREVIEETAGTKLDELFDYIYTTKELDYKKYLGYAGLQVDGEWKISRIENPDALQSEIYKSWLSN